MQINYFSSLRIPLNYFHKFSWLKLRQWGTKKSVLLTRHTLNDRPNNRCFTLRADEITIWFLLLAKKKTIWNTTYTFRTYACKQLFRLNEWNIIQKIFFLLNYIYALFYIFVFSLSGRWKRCREMKNKSHGEESLLCKCSSLLARFFWEITGWVLATLSVMISGCFPC